MNHSVGSFGSVRAAGTLVFKVEQRDGLGLPGVIGGERERGGTSRGIDELDVGDEHLEIADAKAARARAGFEAGATVDRVTARFGGKAQRDGWITCCLWISTSTRSGEKSNRKGWVERRHFHGFGFQIFTCYEGCADTFLL